jgi:hypothetical protein
MKVNWGYGWSTMMGQIGYPRAPLPKPVRVLLRIFWVAVGAVLCLPLLVVVAVGGAIVLYVLNRMCAIPTTE